jgi:undecaprenyl-diphosphatase
MNRIIEYDREVFLFLNNLGSERWDGLWLFITNTYSAIPLYSFLLVICLRKFRFRTAILILVMVAAMIAFTDQAANFFKDSIHRLRPCHEEAIRPLMRLVKAYCGGKFGFFSAHAANTAAVASFFSLALTPRYKIVVPVLASWAIAVAYSRIYIGVHYPLDVLAGLGVGALTGWLFYKATQFFNRRFLSSFQNQKNSHIHKSDKH